MEQIVGLSCPSTLAAPVKAARYVRMSTEHQRYSTQNQADAIDRYALLKGFEVVAVYEDKGKSGLRIDGRDALKLLLSDVKNGRAEFQVILVYDVSRWGRFQDADESAYYEYLCKERGITVHYCAEQFDNDGSLSSTIIKSMKRAMAGEYSRELSAKVFAGHCKLTGLGFKQGGTAGYGLRRILVDEHGNAKGTLIFGDRKSLQTDRVVLALGPPSEVETVRRIYRLFLEDGLLEREIADLLNAEGVQTDLGRAWTTCTVNSLLTNEKYIGNSVYNRLSFKLKKRRVVNPEHMWVRGEHAFEAIITSEVFNAVRAVMRTRSRRRSDDEMLVGLATLLRQCGRLSSPLINQQAGIASSTAYAIRFGGLTKAYRLVGYSSGRCYPSSETRRRSRALRSGAVTAATRGIEALGGAVTSDVGSGVMLINGEFTAAIVILRSSKAWSGGLRWRLKFHGIPHADITVAIRLDESNRAVSDYLVLPRLDAFPATCYLRERNGLAWDTYRSDSIESLCRLGARSVIGRAA